MHAGSTYMLLMTTIVCCSLPCDSIACLQHTHLNLSTPECLPSPPASEEMTMDRNHALLAS